MCAALQGERVPQREVVPAGNLSASVGTFPMGVDCRTLRRDGDITHWDHIRTTEFIRSSRETSIMAGVERLRL